MEEVARWLREAGKAEEIRHLRSGASIKDASEAGETWYDRAAQVAAMWWRPIEEAPENVECVLAYNPQEGLSFLWTGADIEELYEGITHFMLLPQPPVKK